VTVAEVLAEKRSDILARWFDAILGSYPPQTAKFMREEKDRFSNPVGHAMQHDTSAILDFVVKADLQEASARFPEDLIKVLALQNLPPSRALEFMFRLKRVLDEEIGETACEGRQEIDSRIDQLTLIAFDVYMRCRESIFQIRIGEIQKRAFGAHAG
jgi:hypothetical protein